MPRLPPSIGFWFLFCVVKPCLVFEDTIEVKVVATVRYTLTDQTLGSGVISSIMVNSIRCTGVILGLTQLLTALYCNTEKYL